MITIANTMDIYIGERSDNVDLESLASLYNCKVVALNGDYAEVEGETTDLDQFARFWSKRVIDIWGE